MRRRQSIRARHSSSKKYLAEDGKPDVEKMGLITFDPVHHTYIQLGKSGLR